MAAKRKIDCMLSESDKKLILAKIKKDVITSFRDEEHQKFIDAVDRAVGVILKENKQEIEKLVRAEVLKSIPKLVRIIMGNMVQGC